MENLCIVKLGGNIIDNEKKYNEFIPAFAKIEGKKILVHGGGKLATSLASKMNVETQMINGRRVTTKESLDIVTMVYAGHISKNLVAKLQQHNCNAIGLSGADANIIKATIRDKKPIDFGYVGDLDSESVNTAVLSNLINMEICPVLNAINHDGNGQLLNTNADTVASSIAIAMSEIYKVKLIMVFDKPGVLKDINDENSNIKLINKKNYQELKDQKIINDGMLPKVENAIKAVENGVDSIILTNPDFICSDSTKHTLIKA
jgi:acetylglutamate kinase